MFITDSDSDGFGLFIIFGLLATLFLIGLILSMLGGGESAEEIFKDAQEELEA